MTVSRVMVCFVLAVGCWCSLIYFQKQQTVGRMTTTINSPATSSYMRSRRHQNPPHQTESMTNHFTTPNNLTYIQQRGYNFLTTTSGCRMASWVYTGPPYNPKDAHGNQLYEDCSRIDPQPASKRFHAFDAATTTMTKTTSSAEKGSELVIQPYDTVYVTLTKLNYFVMHVLPHIPSSNIVLITGQMHLVTDVIPDSIVEEIIRSPKILHWFCQNLNVYVNTTKSSYNMLPNPKIGPFPYGLREDSSVETYRKVFLQTLRKEETQRQKHQTFGDTTSSTSTTNSSSSTRKGLAMPMMNDPEPSDNGNEENYFHKIYVGYLSPTNEERRSGVPSSLDQQNGTASSVTTIPSSSVRLPKALYLLELSEYDYVLSPNGDRPECFR